MPWVAVKKFTGQGADRVLRPTFSEESKTSAPQPMITQLSYGPMGDFK